MPFLATSTTEPGELASGKRALKIARTACLQIQSSCCLKWLTFLRALGWPES
jgi:hypothetical protein